jgi:XTP/dITP diphosphohydrolase
VQILLATWNDIKVEWLTKGFSHLGFTTRPVNRHEVEDVEENGSTCAENALIKVRAVGAKENTIIIGEDSALSINALNGFPGVKTARWMEGTDDDRSIEFLKKLKDVPQEKRCAKFISSIAVLFPNGDEKVFTGELKGSITTELIGEEGKGYQRIFLLPGGKTLAQSNSTLINENNHRGQAMKKAAEEIINWLDKRKEIK